jgi:hypothetical protein
MEWSRYLVGLVKIIFIPHSSSGEVILVYLQHLTFYDRIGSNPQEYDSKLFMKLS